MDSWKWRTHLFLEENGNPFRAIPSTLAHHNPRGCNNEPSSAFDRESAGRTVSRYGLCIHLQLDHAGIDHPPDLESKHDRLRWLSQTQLLVPGARCVTTWQCHNLATGTAEVNMNKLLGGSKKPWDTESGKRTLEPFSRWSLSCFQHNGQFHLSHSKPGCPGSRPPLFSEEKPSPPSQRCRHAPVRWHQIGSLAANTPKPCRRTCDHWRVAAAIRLGCPPAGHHSFGEGHKPHVQWSTMVLDLCLYRRTLMEGWLLWLTRIHSSSRVPNRFDLASELRSPSRTAQALWCGLAHVRAAGRDAARSGPASRACLGMKQPRSWHLETLVFPTEHGDRDGRARVGFEP